MSIRAFKLGLVLVAVTVVHAFGTHHFPDHRNPCKVRFSIIAEMPQTPVSSFALNQHLFLVQLIDSKGGKTLAKLSYRRLAEEQDFPAELIRPDLLQTFMARREDYCDEEIDSMTTRVTWNERGEAQQMPSVRYLSGASVLPVTSPSPLPCYVIRPRDYRGRKKWREGRK